MTMTNFGPPVTALPEEVDAHGFTYSSGDPRFEAVNVYYAIDTFQRYLQDPTRGPAVTTARNSPISCDPHEGADAAFYSPIDRGLHFSNSGPCRPDRAEDAHVMIHEYGHAIQDDQVPGWGVRNPVTGRRETRAMGEGYGDMAACIFFAEHAAQHAQLGRRSSSPGCSATGAGCGGSTGPRSTRGTGRDQEHADGEIWSAALWNAYLAVGGGSAVPAERAAAADAVIKTVTLSHHLLAASASMPDGAEAVLRTDAALPHYRGRHLTALLDSFHARGILAVDPAAALALGTGSATVDSPDLWVRQVDDDGTTHQAPQPGQDNVCLARVRNAGTVSVARLRRHLRDPARHGHRVPLPRRLPAPGLGGLWLRAGSGREHRAEGDAAGGSGAVGGHRGPVAGLGALPDRRPAVRCARRRARQPRPAKPRSAAGGRDRTLTGRTGSSAQAPAWAGSVLIAGGDRRRSVLRAVPCRTACTCSRIRATRISGTPIAPSRFSGGRLRWLTPGLLHVARGSPPARRCASRPARPGCPARR